MSQLPVAPCIFFQLPSLITFTSEPQICSNTFTNSKQKWSLLQALKPVPPWVFHSHFQNDILTIQCLKKIETQITSMFLMNLRFNITFSRKTKNFPGPKYIQCTLLLVFDIIFGSKTVQKENCTLNIWSMRKVRVNRIIWEVQIIQCWNFCHCHILGEKTGDKHVGRSISKLMYVLCCA